MTPEAVTSLKPVRVQRKRTKGFNLQSASPNGLPVVYVGRPSKWGNPWRVGTDGSVQECIHRFRMMIATNVWTEPNKKSIQAELRGKNLACWCPLCKRHADGRDFDEKCSDCQPCHADILLDISNGDIPAVREV